MSQQGHWVSGAATPLVGMFGGTFDPVHIAHLRVGLDIVEAGYLEQLRLIPCHVPPHRGDPEVTTRQRLAMLRLAVRGEPRLVVDERELQRDGPSYTADTLATLQRDFPHAHLCLLLGTDSFVSLPTWDRWRELAEYAHVIVMTRPDYPLALPAALEQWLHGREVAEWRLLREQRAGYVLHQEVTAMAVSATAIRDRLGRGRSGRYLLPDAVWEYIRDNGLYGAGADAG